jgi:hypothetical protein
MDKTFVRRSFYLEPPQKGATQEEWENWLKLDDQEAKTAKARFTRSRKSQQLEDTPAMNVSKVRGVYKQVPALGFVEQGESGGRFEPIIEAPQEALIDTARQVANALHRRGGSRQYRNKDKRAQIRLARKAKYRVR